MIKLSVVIGTYNQRETLQTVLDSLYKQTLSPELYEIIVVDSMSNDGTEEMVKNLPSLPPQIKYIRQENQGRPGARNRGISNAQGEIIFLTDADMVADPNLLREHLKAHEKHANAIFEGLTLNPKNPEFTEWQPYIKEKVKPGQKLKWAYFLGGNLSIRKKTILGIGLFDMAFAGYGWEDIELGYRLHLSKVPIYYLPEAVNYHHHWVSDEEMFKRKYSMGRSAAIFYKKHPVREIKLFLGMNFLAMGIFNYINKRPKTLRWIEEKAKGSKFYRYILEEYLYRKGLTESL